MDRRAWCRIEARPEGLELESKDVPPQRVGAVRLSDLVPSADLDWTLPLLRATGVDTALRIVVHGRVPVGTGLGVRAARAVALAAALGAWREERLQARALAQVVLRGASGAGSASGAPAAMGVSELDVWTALFGGAVRLSSAGAARIALDPGKLEERLLLLDVGLPATAAAAPGATSGRADDDLVRALATGAWDDVGALLEVELADALLQDSGAVGQVARQARILGGRVWMCSSGAAGLLGVWIAPDGRRALMNWMRTSASGARLVTSRLDLLGFEVESV